MSSDTVPVTQADREVAADIWRDYIARTGEVIVERGIREGGIDDGLPSILARHRLAATPTPSPGMPSREEIARVIDPDAAKCLDKMTNDDVWSEERGVRYKVWASRWSVCYESKWRDALTKADAILALTSVDRASETGWMPIETAPKDGTWFLACATEPGWGATRIVRFANPSDRLPIHGEGQMWPSAPTHWRPLPEPPALSSIGSEVE